MTSVQISRVEIVRAFKGERERKKNEKREKVYFGLVILKLKFLQEQQTEP